MRQKEKMSIEHPIPGLGVMILKDGKVLLGKRKGSHGAGEYSFPGGHLELGESFVNCIIREVKEETGLVIKNIRFLCVANITKYMEEDSKKHYVHLGFIADWESGEPEILEKEKCEGWDWYDIDDLPPPLFEPASLMFESYYTGKACYDTKPPYAYDVIPQCTDIPVRVY